jgi:hypothetical protein
MSLGDALVLIVVVLLILLLLGRVAHGEPL